VKIRFGLILLIIGILAIACIGYFIFTATLSSPTSMNLYIPKDPEKDTVNHNNNTKKKVTLILLKDERVFGYYGDLIRGGRSVSVDETGKLITDGLKMFSRDSVVVVIKPAKEASYKSTVAILDQMTLHQIEKYSMVDLSKKEREFLKIDE
jgi:biopolymer transport protein ExbD